MPARPAGRDLAQAAARPADLPWPARWVDERDLEQRHAVHLVWELTLACNLACAHCGSRAGARRPDELTTAECLDVVAQLPGVGTRHVTLIGGEAFLRRDWVDIVGAITSLGIACSLQSGGLHLTKERLAPAAAAGLGSVGISLDGPPDVHDDLRGRAGSFDAAVAALRAATGLGLSTSVNTQLTPAVLPHLAALADVLAGLGVRAWQVQLTVPAGRAADRPDLVLQPADLLVVMPLLARLFREGLERDLQLQVGNNVGFFGPFEALLRGLGTPGVHYGGCNAGLTGFGLEADGTVKGCPSLAPEPYAAGSVRDAPLSELIAAAQVRPAAPRPAATAWGLCRLCYYADVCEGGCTWVATAVSGRAGNNPYCHHRALDLSAVGLGERIRPVGPPPGRPFDHATFELLVEEVLPDGRRGAVVDAAEAERRLAGLGSWSVPSGAPSPPDDGESASPTVLEPCGHCHRHVRVGSPRCPHCHEDIAQAQARLGQRIRAARSAERELLTLIGKAGV